MFMASHKETGEMTDTLNIAQQMADTTTAVYSVVTHYPSAPAVLMYLLAMGSFFLIIIGMKTLKGWLR